MAMIEGKMKLRLEISSKQYRFWYEERSKRLVEYPMRMMRVHVIVIYFSDLSLVFDNFLLMSFS